MQWRQLRSGELDHERIWLAVSISIVFIGWVLIDSGIPLPKCIWHELTGLPCPGCGGTRCARAIVSGSIGTAFVMNPLVFASLGAAVLYNVYAAIVLVFRLPRLRFSDIPAWFGFWSRIGAAVLFAMNWTWLIVARR